MSQLIEQMRAITTRHLGGGQQYVCHLCNGTYERWPGNVFNCLTIHGPGECCHYNERYVPQVAAVETWWPK